MVRVNASVDAKGKPVVILPGGISDKQRGLFKDKTVFIELPKPALPKGPPAPPAKG